MRSSVSIFRRAAAWLVDYLAVMIPGMLVVLLAVAQLVNGLPGFVGGVAAEKGFGYLAGIVFRTGAGSSTPISSEWVAFAVPLIVALLLVPVFQFVYQGVMLSWRGRTLGKMLLDTRVASSTSDTERLRRGPAMRRAFLTAALETGVVAAALVLITIGQLLMGILLWGVAIIAFWINAFSVFSAGRRSIIDRLSGTAVLPRGLYVELATAAKAALPTRRSLTVQAQRALESAPPQPAASGSPPAQHALRAASYQAAAPTQPAHGTQSTVETAQPAAQPAHPMAPAAETAQPAPQPGHATPSTAEAARAAGRKASDAAIAAGRATADAAAVARQLAKEGAETVIRSDAVQQALNSRAGQQAQALGAAGAEKAKELGAAGAEQARKLRGKAQELWRQRRANRPADDSDPQP